MTSLMKENVEQFNVLLGESIDETITTLLSREVADALYLHLQKAHNVTKDEVPCKLDIFCSTLENTFGLPSSRTISKVIARKFFVKLGFSFINNSSRTLIEYVEEAETKLRDRGSQL